jgi:hypothetical protein
MDRLAKKGIPALWAAGGELDPSDAVRRKLVVEGVVEVEEDGPKDGGGEENGGDFAAGGESETPGGVRAVEFAEAVFEGGTRAAFAGGV